ncbi:hypothetical protein [uncultured Thiodictyon sp.]|uniref:hypothetical protein n=1 Tax=uncultured Thiodictyon sp. TaxID=1846217 RepID=UPI0025EF89CB|nr:hypothetical protein [uncultured Thiodictyon sp.]
MHQDEAVALALSDHLRRKFTPGALARHLHHALGAGASQVIAPTRLVHGTEVGGGVWFQSPRA